jgi:hypothetical protein
MAPRLKCKTEHTDYRAPTVFPPGLGSSPGNLFSCGKSGLFKRGFERKALATSAAEARHAKIFQFSDLDN